MSSVEGQNASTSLPAGSGAGTITGTVVDFGAIYANVLAVITASATLTAGTILIEGSIDGNTWYQINSVDATATFTAAGTKPFVASPMVPARYARARVSVALTGGTIGVMIGAAGS